MLGIDSFLALVDQLLQLLQERRHRKRQLFLEILEPLFIEVQPVVDEYLSFFRNARSLVQKTKVTEIGLVVLELANSHRDFFTVRTKVSQIAAAIRSQTRDSTILGFLGALDGFFNATRITEKKIAQQARDFYDPPSIRTDLIRRIGRMPYHERQEVAKRDLISYIDQTLDKLEEKWLELAHEYGWLRLISLQGARRPR